MKKSGFKMKGSPMQRNFGIPPNKNIKKMKSLPPKTLPTGGGTELGNEADAKSIHSGYENLKKFSTKAEKMKRYRIMQEHGYKGDPPA